MTALLGVLVASLAYREACPPHDWAMAAWLIPGVLLVSCRRLPPVRAFAAGTLFGVLLGGPRLATEGEARNAASWIDPSGAIRGSYDKQRLVPFAEYNPLPNEAADPQDGPTYTPGPDGEPMHTDAGPLGVAICYEILFPHIVNNALVHRAAEILVNLSNDSWLDGGDGAAPHPQRVA